jgi:pimeloyl-ACP methyl ester carboxylesterase
MGRLLFLVAAACIAHAAWAQDAAREQRWAEQVVPDVVVGDAVWLELRPGRKFLGLYTEVKGARTAVLLVHGIGVHPDHGVIGILRVALSDMGYTTLSIQMPVLASDARPAEYYPKLFPEAGERIAVAARWLQEKGYRRIVLLSHSLGSWMSEWYLERTPGAPFAAWVCLGRAGAFGDISKIGMPVLDVYGENDLPQVLGSAAERRVAATRQIMIAHADHFYTGREQPLAEAVKAFIEALK